MTFDWGGFEAELQEACRGALTRLGRQQREVFYVVALYGVYAEADGELGLPLLAANTVSAGAPADGSFWGERFNPNDFRYSELPLNNARSRALQRALTGEACRDTPRHWVCTHQKYLQALVRIALRLRDDAPTLLKVSDDFVAFVHDMDGGADVAKKTIAPKRFRQLFPATIRGAKERQAIARQPPRDRVTRLIAALDSDDEGMDSERAQLELVKLGTLAVPAVLGLLGSHQNGWVAAKVLGEIGDPSPQVLRALRARAKKADWPARALGMLRDHAWLTRQKPDVAICGLTAPLSGVSTDVRRLPLAYAPLETYLARAGKPALQLTEKSLAPGRSYCSIIATDVDEAMRGLSSRYAVIRWHACSLLGERALGSAAGKRILPALAERLADRHAIVRRSAVLAISNWKVAAKPYRAAVAALARDRDEVVRRTVASLQQRR